MFDPNSLVATRTKRANAGSRLKQLIEIEELASTKHTFYTDDDQNVELLFQEDENDVEFLDEQDISGAETGNSDDEKSDGSDGQERSDRQDRSDGSDGSDLESQNQKSRSLEQDDMLSDSDLSVSEDDNSEGERELEKNERAQKRRKKTSIIPAIKKPKKVSAPKPKPTIKHSELLLLSHRRASSRKSALKSKEELLQKLKESESRRSAFTPVVRVQERQLTQEERLAEAEETEKKNIVSLHQFLGQEIVKKERQKWMLLQKRVKLKNVIRLYSTESFVSPIDEIEDHRHVQDVERKKKARRRRPADAPEEWRFGDVDKELPYYQKEQQELKIKQEREAEELRIKQEAKAERKRKIEQKIEQRRKELEHERLQRKAAKEERLKEFENVDVTEKTNQQISELRDNLKSTHDLEHIEDSRDGDEDPDDSGVRNDLELDEVDDSMEIDQEKSENETSNQTTVDPRIKKEMEDLIEEEDLQSKNINQTDSQIHTPEPEDSRSHENSEGNDLNGKSSPSNPNIKDGETEKESTIKTVSFAEGEDTANQEAEPEQDGEKDEYSDTENHRSDTPKTENEDSDLEDGEVDNLEDQIARWYRPSKWGSVYEGPVQHVGRNHVFLIDFDDQERWGLTEVKIKAALFGEEANLGGPRRFKNVKTILKSSIRLENPYGPLKEEKEDELFKPVTDISEDDPMFESLKRLPRLGTKEIIEEESTDEKKEEKTDIQIHTEAPSGLYLPNGYKKLCLISGKEVRYFDPATGIPYENKEVYQTIKKIEQGVYSWTSMGRDVNTYGSVQVYLNNREGNRHAQGVPEGFDE